MRQLVPVYVLVACRRAWLEWIGMDSLPTMAATVDLDVQPVPTVAYTH
jgi:hypothetical protein